MIPDNVKFANSTIKVKVGDRTYTKQYILGGEGYGGDQSRILSLGLGKSKKVDKVTVETIRGGKYEYENPKINSTLVIVDGSNRKYTF